MRDCYWMGDEPNIYLYFCLFNELLLVYVVFLQTTLGLSTSMVGWFLQKIALRISFVVQRFVRFQLDPGFISIRQPSVLEDGNPRMLKKESLLRCKG